MAQLAHARFQRIHPDGTPIGAPIEAKINPTEITFSKNAQFAEVGIPGLDSPILQFVRGQTETLSFDLFFDTTDAGMDGSVEPVTKHTDRVYELVKIDGELHAPPVVLFSWGDGGFPGSLIDDDLASQRRKQRFQCVVDSVKQRFTLFSPSGVPLRATVSVSLKEYKTLQQQAQQLNLRSPDHTRAYVYQAGERLDRLAWKFYGKASEWRRIAEANNIDDPLTIQPGAVLELPPIQ